MSEAETSHEVLLERAAVHHQVDPDLLKGLLAIEKDFPDFSIFGSKAAFTRRVAAVLDAAIAKAVNE